MEIATFTENLHRDLREHIKSTMQLPAPFKKKTSLIISRAADCIQEINKHLKAYRFEDEASEIDYFKNLLPQIYAQHYIYLRLHQMDAEKPILDDKLQQFILKKRQQMDDFLESHQDFYKYYLDESTHLDARYFVRQRDHHNCLEFFMPIMDYDCLTPYSVKVAMFLAFEFVKEYIDGILLKLKENAGLPDMPYIEQRNLRQKKVVWTGKQVAAVELVAAMYANKCFNDGKISLTQLISYFEDVWGFPMPNALRTIQDIVRRKGSTCLQLEEMKDDLEAYLEKHYNK